MGLIILRHGKDRNHGDGAILALLTSCSLIQRSQIRIHISRIASTARNFFAGCGNLTKRVCVICNIRQNNQNMHVLLKGQILGRSESHTGRCDTLYRRVIGQVNKHYAPVDSPCLPETLHKKVGFLKGDAHCRKYYSKRLIGAAHLSLTGNLSRKVSMRKTGC